MPIINIMLNINFAIKKGSTIPASPLIFLSAKSMFALVVFNLLINFSKLIEFVKPGINLF